MMLEFLRRSLPLLVALASLFVLSGCVDIGQDDGCVSDADCRFDRMCGAQGFCVEPAPVEPEPDAGPEPDVEPPNPQPTLSASPARVEFDRVDHHDPTWRRAWKLTTLTNEGSETLEIDDIRVVGNEHFELTFPSGPDDETPNSPNQESSQWPDQIAGGESLPMRVWYETETNEPQRGRVVVESNDPRGPFEIPLAADLDPPCVQVSPESDLYFTPRGPGEQIIERVTVANCSETSSLAIRSVRVEYDGGGLFYVPEESLPGRLPDYSAIIEPGGRVELPVVFTGERDRWNAGELVIETNVPERPLIRIGLLRSTDRNDCPIARAIATVDGERHEYEADAVVDQTVELSGAQSVDPDGEVARWEWSIVQRPFGSNSRLIAGSSPSDVNFLLDAPGRYTFELQVYDDQGLSSCSGAARLSVTARNANNRLHVQLAWQQPGAPDPDSSQGATDLDLHLLHPRGFWGHEPYDVWPGNPEAEWSDDPERQSHSVSLDADDTGAWGTENISFGNPLSNLAFRVGVMYVDDAEFGPSYATVRIYADSQLIMELEDRYLEKSGIFWEVAKLTYPGPDAQEVNWVGEGYPER